VLIGSTPETEWDETQQAYILALAAYRRRICGGCGGDLEETTAPENEDRYKAELPLQCHRCKEFARVQERYRDEPHSHTFLHVVRLRPSRG
jgi:hypothetical protein